jgi:azurin
MRLLIVCLLALFAIACSKGDANKAKADDKAKSAATKDKKTADKAKKETPKPAKKPAPKPAVNVVKDDGKVVTVALTGNDQMQFNVKQITVAAGRTVKLTLKHVGKAPLIAMGHNFVLLKAGTDVAAFAAKAATAKATGHIPESDKASVLAHTKLIGGGQSDSIEFAAPAAGTYDYICTFPGHYAVMRGKFTVK